MAQNRISILVQAQQTRKAARDVDQVKDSVKGLGDETERTGKKNRQAEAETKVFHDRLMKLSAALSGELFKRMERLLKPASAIAGLGLAAQMFGVAAAAAGAFAMALAPAAGALVALPAAALAAAQGMGMLKLATAGVGNAVGGLGDKLDTSSAAFKSLTGPAKAFARTLQGLKPGVRDLQRTAQRGLFPGVEKGLKALHPLLGTLKPIVAATAKAVGGLAAQAGKMFGSAAWQRSITTVGNANVKTINTLGDAGLHMANVARRLLVAVQPLVHWLARLADAAARGLDRFTKTQTRSGGLAAFFDKTRVTVAKLVSIAGSLGKVLISVFRGAYGPGQRLLTSIQQGAASLAKWAGSARGAKQIHTYFQNAVAPARELGRLVRDTVKGFAGLSQGGHLAPLIRQLRTQLLPTVLNVVKSTTKAFGPALISMLTALGQAFAPLAGSSGPLVLLAKGLTGLAKAAAWIENKVPGASTALSTLSGALAVLGAVGLASFSSHLLGVGRGLTALKAGFGAAKTAATTVQGAMSSLTLTNIKAQIAMARFAVTVALTKARMIATAAASKVWAAAQWLLNAALTANPITLIIAGVAALAAGLVIAYKKSATFRGIVQTVWKVLKVALAPAFDIVKGAIHRVIDIVGTLGGAFKDAFKGLAGFVGGVFNTVLGVIKGAIKTATNFINDLIIAFNKVPGHKNIGLIGITQTGSLESKVPLGKGTFVGKFPHAATGGLIKRSGMSWVGEEGPELVRLPQAAEVVPHKASMAMGSGAPLRLHDEDMRTIARYLAESVNDKQVVLTDEAVHEANRRARRRVVAAGG